MYKVFKRTWWRKNDNWPDGLEPFFGRKTTLRKGLTLEEARAFATDWNRKHKPGKYSMRAEFEKM